MTYGEDKINELLEKTALKISLDFLINRNDYYNGNQIFINFLVCIDSVNFKITAYKDNEKEDTYNPNFKYDGKGFVKFLYNIIYEVLTHPTNKNFKDKEILEISIDAANIVLRNFEKAGLIKNYDKEETGKIKRYYESKGIKTDKMIYTD